MNKKSLLLTVAISGLWASSAHAIVVAPPSDGTVSYSISNPNFSTGITNIFAYAGNGQVERFWHAADVPAAAANHHFSAPTNGFTGSSVGNFMLGLTTDLPGDTSPGQEHVVMTVRNAVVQNVIGQSWEQVISPPFYAEANVIAALKAYALNPVNEDTNPAYFFLYVLTLEFMGNYFFTVNGVPGETIAEPYSLVAFSNATPFGTGTVNYTMAPVPEPAAWALMALGLLVVGAMV
jgi:hypothetical protein